MGLLGFRMALLSGEVETWGNRVICNKQVLGSGWLCYPGKLKRWGGLRIAAVSLSFRMALLSGEVETGCRGWPEPWLSAFRMALLSGEVETLQQRRTPDLVAWRSGWLCYPGKLKHWDGPAPSEPAWSSGWLCYPGKLKPRRGLGEGQLHLDRSGWLCYPGKLKHPLS